MTYSRRVTAAEVCLRGVAGPSSGRPTSAGRFYGGPVDRRSRRPDQHAPAHEEDGGGDTRLRGPRKPEFLVARVGDGQVHPDFVGIVHHSLRHLPDADGFTPLFSTTARMRRTSDYCRRRKPSTKFQGRRRKGYGIARRTRRVRSGKYTEKFMATWSLTRFA